MPGTPFHEEGGNRVYRLRPRPMHLLFRGGGGSRTDWLSRGGDRGARVDAVERPAVSPRS